ncbi:MAG: ATP-binding protein [Treponema sp.]|nr:ATP-binding protein [Treponema sp.]
MLLQFSFKNHRSINDEVTFSTLATSDTEHLEELIEFGEEKFIRAAEIYGANGSGKTSILNALGQMQLIVINSFNHQPGDGIIRFPHKLAVSEQTEFTCIFEKNSIKYSYQFSYDESGIQHEVLFHWPNGRVATIFERDYTNFSYNAKYQQYAKDTKSYLKPNRLLLSVAANITDIQEITDAFLFFKEDIVVFPGMPNNWLEYSANRLQADENLKNDFLNIMHQSGSDICDIASKIEIRLPSENELRGLPKSLIEIFSTKKINHIDIKLAYKDFVLSLNEESAGVQRLFSFICPVLDILNKGKVFICDEIETSLHPSVVKYFVDRFQKNTKTQAQIIFTTHNTDLLDLKQIRRDQIWFTEINPNGRQTDFYSLSEIKNVRKDENIKKGYISGKYGAIPMPNSEIQRICEE